MKRTLTTHQHNLQLLMIEIYKTKHSLNPTFMRDFFAERNNQHNLRNENNLRLPVANTTTYGLETIEYRGCLLWFTLPPEIKDSKSLSEFKWKSKKFSFSFSYNLGRVALQLVLVSMGPSIYFTIYFIISLKTKLKHIMNKIYRNT